MITDEEFRKAASDFDILERRGSFYDMAVNLYNKNFKIEAYLLILSTWNFGAFRYAVTDFDINGLRNKMKELNPYFDRMENENFKNIDFDNYREDIKKIYDALAQIKGITHTGASKVMHLRNRKVFVMWDNYIRGGEAKRYYKKLSTFKGDFKKEFKRYGKDSDGYFQFLKDMQDRFKKINFQHPKKTFSKAIDEYNYVNITLQIQAMKKQEEYEKARLRTIKME
jgi:hypothetical protein